MPFPSEPSGPSLHIFHPAIKQVDSAGPSCRRTNRPWSLSWKSQPPQWKSCARERWRSGKFLNWYHRWRPFRGRNRPRLQRFPKKYAVCLFVSYDKLCWSCSFQRTYWHQFCLYRVVGQLLTHPRVSGNSQLLIWMSFFCVRGRWQHPETI